MLYDTFMIAENFAFPTMLVYKFVLYSYKFYSILFFPLKTKTRLKCYLPSLPFRDWLTEYANLSHHSYYPTHKSQRPIKLYQTMASNVRADKSHRHRTISLSRLGNKNSEQQQDQLPWMSCSEKTTRSVLAGSCSFSEFSILKCTHIHTEWQDE